MIYKTTANRFILKCRYEEELFDNGYSRNLLWRLWHASWAFEMEHLSERCGKVIELIDRISGILDK
jgi:hypothetical protein